VDGPAEDIDTFDVRAGATSVDDTSRFRGGGNVQIEASVKPVTV